jgi:hypothetical protein
VAGSNVQCSSEDEASRGGEAQKMADEEARVKAEDWTVRTVRVESVNARDEMGVVLLHAQGGSVVGIGNS